MFRIEKERFLKIFSIFNVLKKVMVFEAFLNKIIIQNGSKLNYQRRKVKGSNYSKFKSFVIKNLFSTFRKKIMGFES